MQPVGEFSRSLEQVIIQGLPLTASASVYTQPSHPTHSRSPSPKPLSHPTLVARPLGHGGVEQLLLHCDISTTIIQGERECREVGTERRETRKQKTGVSGTGRDGRINEKKKKNSRSLWFYVRN